MTGKYSVEFIEKYGAQPLTAWLIEAALARDTLTYGEAKLRLEAELDVQGQIFSTHVGRPAGQLMNDIHLIDPDAPLLNVILVSQRDGLPGQGAGHFMAERYSKPELRQEKFRTTNAAVWRSYFERAAAEVFDFRDWKSLFEKTYALEYSRYDKSPYAPENKSASDSGRYGAGGEGPQHRVT